MCTKYCCKSLNKQSSGVQERINPFYINSYGENSFGLRTFRFTIISVYELFGLRTFRFANFSVYNHFGLRTFRFTVISIYEIFVLRTFRFTIISVYELFGLRTFRFTNFSVYEHFGLRTFRFTNELQERIKFVNRDFVDKPDRNRLLGRQRHRLEDNIKMSTCKCGSTHVTLPHNVTP